MGVSGSSAAEAAIILSAACTMLSTVLQAMLRLGNQVYLYKIALSLDIGWCSC